MLKIALSFSEFLTLIKFGLSPRVKLSSSFQIIIDVLEFLRQNPDFLNISYLLREWSSMRIKDEESILIVLTDEKKVKLIIKVTFIEGRVKEISSIRERWEGEGEDLFSQIRERFEEEVSFYFILKKEGVRNLVKELNQKSDLSKLFILLSVLAKEIKDKNLIVYPLIFPLPVLVELDILYILYKFSPIIRINYHKRYSLFHLPYLMGILIFNIFKKAVVEGLS